MPPKRTSLSCFAFPPPHLVCVPHHYPPSAALLAARRVRGVYPHTVTPSSVSEHSVRNFGGRLALASEKPKFGQVALLETSLHILQPVSSFALKYRTRSLMYLSANVGAI